MGSAAPRKVKGSRSGRPLRPGRAIAERVFFTKAAEAKPALFYGLTALLLTFVLAASYCNIRSLDIWWHLKTGEWILQNTAIPKADPFSHTAAGRPWVAHEWLFGLLSYAVHRLGGTTGIVIGKALLIGILFGLTAWTARLRGAHPGFILLVLAAGYAISRFRFTERPELVSLPLAVGFLLVHQSASRRPRLLLALPFLQILWVNAHGGTALLGWGLAGALLLDRAAEWRKQGDRWAGFLRRKEVGYWCAAVAGVLLVSVINPHGPAVLSYGLLRTESPLDNKEFQSFLEMMRDGADLSVGLFIAFVALLAVYFAVRLRSVRLFEWLLFGALLLLTLVFFRFRPYFVFLLAPTLARHLSLGSSLSRLRWWAPALAAGSLLSATASVDGGGYFYRFGAGVHSGVIPVAAGDFIRQNRLSGRMFNTYGMGGYLIWLLWPGQKVFIDGREDVYLGPGVLEEYVHCFDSRERWRSLVSKYEIDYAVVRYPERPPDRPDASLDQMAFPRDEWALLYFDDAALIYARRNGGNDAVIQEREVRSVQPLQLSGYMDGVLSDPEELRLFLAEMDANLREHPDSFRAHFTLGILAAKRGPQSAGEALRHFERASALNPDFAPAHFNLGSIFAAVGRFADAERALNKALSLERNPAAEQQLRAIRSRR
jgi:hypothetical protein